MRREITLVGGPFDGQTAVIYKAGGRWPDAALLSWEGKALEYRRKSNRQFAFCNVVVEIPSTHAFMTVERTDDGRLRVFDPTGKNDYSDIDDPALVDKTGGTTEVTYDHPHR